MHPDTTGIDDARAAQLLALHGPNELPASKPRHVFAIVLEVAREPMFLLLAAGAFLYVVLGDLQGAIILLVSVLVVVGITVYQERKTERALDALRDLSSPRALVLRAGERRRIAGRDVVPGDLLLLHEGDRVPADGMLLECTDLSVDESLLSGESIAVDKRAACVSPARERDQAAAMPDPGDGAQSFVFSGSLVVRGYGSARVLATGARTKMGHIGKALASVEVRDTPLQLQTARAVRVFAALGLAACVAVVLLYGLLKSDWLAGLLSGITLAMAVLPEEFPVVLTVFLALGAWRISRRNVLTRRVPAIETLGSATVLCVDKTGTLTENRMAVAELAAGEGRHDARRGPLPEGLRAVARFAALACERDPFDPMERAIVDYAVGQDADTARQRTGWRLVKEYDLTPGLLAVTHCWRDEASGEVVVASKGAPEAIATLCQADAELRAWLARETADIAARGCRVLGVARARFGGSSFPVRPDAFAFQFVGLIALADPVRATVPAAIRQCADAGIRVVMITGDHAGTARAIADEIGLPSPGGVLTGPQIADMTGEELRRRVAGVGIFARVLPEQKLALVEALRANGEIVAMTGDGVNDAPALAAAHIGIAMGGRGTDVAREAASLVLLEDDFGSIVDTVRLGRRIYDNIRHAMSYLIAVHMPTAGMALLPVIFGWPAAFAPVHIVFLEFVIDPACSIAFEAEPAHPATMRRPPRDPDEPLLDARLVAGALAQGIALLAAVAGLYWMVLAQGFDAPRARAMAFSALVLGNVALILANRSRSLSVLATLQTPNPALWLVVAGALCGLALALYVPALQAVFGFSGLRAVDVGFCVVTGFAGVAASELARLAVAKGVRRG